jgi:hypothetical protein
VASHQPIIRKIRRSSVGNIEQQVITDKERLGGSVTRRIHTTAAGDIVPEVVPSKSQATSEEESDRIRAGSDVLVAWAAYSGKMPLEYVKSARMAGFDGQIILAVSPKLSEDQHQELKKLGVTLRFVEDTPCQLPYEAPNSSYKLRVLCPREFPSLKFESARFALAGKWIKECKECTGWALVSDFGDILFQRKPFQGLGRPIGNELHFVQEYAGKNATDRWGITAGGRGIDNTHWFTNGGVKACHGDAEAKRMGNTPVICSGSIFGAREPMIAAMEKLQAHFEQNVKRGPQCDPTRIADQASLNYLVYNTDTFADLKPKTWKFGEGPIQTIGVPCGGSKQDPGHSKSDIVHIKDGLVFNNNDEPVNAVHQDKVCWKNYHKPYSRRYDAPIGEVLASFRQNVDSN